MEFVNQIIAYLTPYFGEYARFAPIVIGAILAIIAFVIKRKVIKGMDADIKNEGSITIPSKILTSYTSLLGKSDEIELSVIDGATLQVKSKSSKTKIKGIFCLYNSSI